MAHLPIDILGIISGDTLELSDGRKTIVHSRSGIRKIKWKIRTSKVKSFRIVAKTSRYPFDGPIPTDYDDKVVLTVKKNEPEYNWDYAIEWYDTSGNYHKDDPIIAIKSSRKDTDVGSLVTWIVSLASLFAISWFFLQKKSNK